MRLGPLFRVDGGAVDGAGVMTIWLPNYSPWGKAAHERASKNKASGAQPQGGLGSASMWKNMNNQERDQ